MLQTLQVKKHFSLFQVLPSEKDLKRSLMNNAIYNEYTVDELQASFGYVSSILINVV